MEKENINPAYYAILTADVRYDKRLTANSKLLFAEITALTNQKGYCWSTNAYFAELYSVSTTSVSKWVSQLVKFGYLESQLIYKEGTKEILYRYLSLVKGGMQEKLNTPTQEKLKDNTTLINNTSNIIYTENNFAYESESEFMEDWNASRKSILGVQSNMKKLSFHESENFKYLNKHFLKEDFKNGMRGLMKQKNGILPTMQLRPDHFLKDLNIEKYIDAHLNKKQLYSDNKKVDRL